MDTLVIRPATVEDADAISRLWEQLVAYHYALDAALPQPSTNGAQVYAQRIANRIDDAYTLTLVAEDNNRIVGYALGVIIDPVPEMFAPVLSGFIADIYVLESHRRQGIGRHLIQEMAQWFLSMKVAHYELHVAAANTAGIAFWKSLGGRELIVRMRHELREEDFD